MMTELILSLTVLHQLAAVRIPQQTHWSFEYRQLLRGSCELRESRHLGRFHQRNAQEDHGSGEQSGRPAHAVGKLQSSSRHCFDDPTGEEGMMFSAALKKRRKRRRKLHLHMYFLLIYIVISRSALYCYTKVIVFYTLKLAKNSLSTSSSSWV